MEQHSEQAVLRHPAILKVAAKTISYVFHPLFVPVYIFLFLIQYFPYEFADISEWQLKMRLFGVFWMTAFFPAFAVFLLWRLKFSESIYLRTRKERIVPYIITMFFYWWMFYLSRNFTDQPAVLKFFYLGIFIASAAGLLLNSYFKISLHGMGAGGAMAAIILFAMYYRAPMGVEISVVTLLAGIVCTSRFIVSDHTSREVYAGLFVGIACQWIAYVAMM